MSMLTFIYIKKVVVLHKKGCSFTLYIYYTFRYTTNLHLPFRFGAYSWGTSRTLIIIRRYIGRTLDRSTIRRYIRLKNCKSTNNKVAPSPINSNRKESLGTG